MESIVLYFGSGEPRALSSHASLSSSPVPPGFDTSFGPPDPPQLSYERFIRGGHHDHEDGGSKFVSLMDLNPTFVAPDPSYEPNMPCYPPQFSENCAPQDFDVIPSLGSLPDEFVSFQYNDGAFAPDTRFGSDFPSSARNESFPQQQEPQYDPRNIEYLQQHMPVMSDEFHGLPSLRLVGNPYGVDSMVNPSQLYVPFELEAECPGYCGSIDIPTSHYEAFCHESMQYLDTSESPIGPPSVHCQTFPQAPGQADFGFSSDPLGAFSLPSVPYLRTCRLCDSDVYTIPSTVTVKKCHNEDLPSNSLPVAAAASHDLQTCSMPMRNFAEFEMQLTALTRVSSSRMEGQCDLVELAIEKFNEETPALGSLQAFEEYREAEFGLSVPSFQDEEGRMPVDGRRNYGKLELENICFPLVRPGTDEPQLPGTLNAQSISEIMRGKEKRTRKSQSPTEPTSSSWKDPLLPFRKKRARKSVERKLNEAIMIFNNEEWEYGDGEQTMPITGETMTARFPSGSTTEPRASSTPALAMRNMTNCTEHNVDYDVGSQNFSDYDVAEEDLDEAAIVMRQEIAPSSVLQFPAAVNGDVLMGELPFFSSTTFEWFEPATSDVSQGGKACTCGCTPHLNAKAVTGVDYNGNEGLLQWSAEQDLSFYPTAEVHSLSDAGNTLEELTSIESNGEIRTKNLEDRRDCLAESDAEVELESREVKAEGMRRRDVCSEAKVEVQLQLEKKSAGRGNRRSAAEEHKTSVCAAAANLSVSDGTEGEAESLSQNDDDSPSTPDATSELAVTDKSPRDTWPGRCERYSRLPMVLNMDPPAEFTYRMGDDHDSGFLEGPCHNDNCKSLVSASDFDVFKFEEPTINLEIDLDVECSEAFTCSPVPDSRMEFRIPTDRKGKAKVDSLIGIVCDQTPSPGIQRVQVPSSRDSAVQLRGKSASLSTSNTAKSCTESHVQGKSRPHRTRARKGKAHDLPGKKLPVRPLRPLKPKLKAGPGAQGGENYVRHPYAGVGSSRSNNSVLQAHMVDHGKQAPEDRATSSKDLHRDERLNAYPDAGVGSSRSKNSLVQTDMVDHGKQAPEDRATSSNDLDRDIDESLNAYQKTLMNLLGGFIDSGYGVGVQPSDDANDGSDIYDELSKGTVVIHSTTKTGKAGIPSSSLSHSVDGIHISSSVPDERTMHPDQLQPAPAKIHKTGSRSRAGARGNGTPVVGGKSKSNNNNDRQR